MEFTDYLPTSSVIVLKSHLLFNFLYNIHHQKSVVSNFKGTVLSFKPAIYNLKLLKLLSKEVVK